MEKKKTTLDFIQSHTLSAVLSTVNTYNGNNPQSPILKEDIVDIINDGGTYILLYYR